MQKTEDGGAEEMRKGPYHHDIVRESMDPEWRVLARQASIEKDPEKLLDLLQQVIEKYDEAKRQARRIA